LRQEILEGLGWEIFRIWSTDWFADPSRQLAKLAERLVHLGKQPLNGSQGRQIDFPAKFGRSNSKDRGLAPDSAAEEPEETTTKQPLAKNTRVAEKWRQLTNSKEYQTSVTKETESRQGNSLLHELLLESFDLNITGLAELVIEVAGSGQLYEFKVVEEYNRAIYQWLEKNSDSHLGSMPWVSNLDVAANVRLRAQAVADLVIRYR